MKVLQMDPCDSDLAIPAFETDYFVLVTEAFVFERDHYDSVLAASVFEMDCFSPAIKIFEKDHFFSNVLDWSEGTGRDESCFVSVAVAVSAGGSDSLIFGALVDVDPNIELIQDFDLFLLGLLVSGRTTPGIPFPLNSRRSRKTLSCR
mmetsp:Transcript_14175/g.16437  ORF Transcript_14175/g.16437 Transcript_14175/m.16437 type:complete len:148 (-) Transcript_14175:148-591(-)